VEYKGESGKLNHLPVPDFGGPLMRQRFTLAMAMMVIVSLGGCGQKEKEMGAGGGSDGSGDPRLDGTYAIAGTEMGGRVDKEAEKERIYTFSGNKMIRPKEKKEEGITIKCDPSKTPNEIDLSRPEASGKSVTFYGIYELDEDTLTICMIRSDNPADRPREFTTKDSTATIWTMKRIK
jgi:uncharacterized protein (TIGR03067 family)